MLQFYDLIVFIAIWLCPATEFCLFFIQRGKNDAAPVLRPLKLEDFIQSKAKVVNFANLSHLYTLSICKYAVLNLGIHDLLCRLALRLLMMLQAWMSWENGMNSMEKGEAGENHLSAFEANTIGFLFSLIYFIIINLFSEKGSRSDLDISPERILSCSYILCWVRKISISIIQGGVFS